MRCVRKVLTLASITALAISGCQTYDTSGDAATGNGYGSSDSQPFGGPDSTAYAAELWAALENTGLTGSGYLVSKPYQGQHPHVAVLDTVEQEITVGDHTGIAIVKRNYGGEGISVSKVADDPEAWLKAVTVMYRREKGYDPDNHDWFWAKYGPDGTLDKNPKGMALAGRVAKGMDAGCIACHSGAPGKDMVFNHDRYVEQ